MKEPDLKLEYRDREDENLIRGCVFGCSIIFLGVGVLALIYIAYMMFVGLWALLA